MFIRIPLYLFASLLAHYSFAHGELDERIAKATQEIKAHPDSAALLQKRGELYFQHEEYENSIADFSNCEKMGYSDPRLDLNFAKSLDRLKRGEEAMPYLDKILRKDKKHVKALQLKARILFSHQKHEEAAGYFEQVIDYSIKTLPLNYFEASRAWENCNTPEDIQKAVAIIQHGIDDLGELLTFYLRLVELSLSSKNYQAAIAYQTNIIEKSFRRERPLYQRAMIHLAAGDKVAARLDLENAEKAIEQLPTRVKNIRATKKLSTTINEALLEL